MSNPAIEAWSAAIREACARYAEYLTQNQYGIQGICCCAGGAVVFDPCFDDEGDTELTSEQIANALQDVQVGDHVYNFIAGLATGFDDDPVDDATDAIYMAGYELGYELLTQYTPQMENP